MTTTRRDGRDLIEALRLPAESVMAAIKARDVEAATEWSRVLHDSIGAQQVLALLDVRDALERLLEAISEGGGIQRDAEAEGYRALARLQEGEPKE